jgi:hypothetical protein
MTEAEKQKKIAAIKAAWHSDKTRTEIQEEFGLSRSSLSNLAATRGWKIKPRAATGDDEKNNPSPEEIAERAAKIRAKWTEKEERQRQIKQKRWLPREYTFNANTQTLDMVE